MNYYDTFIQVAPDCPASKAIVPFSKRETKSIPQIEYELLAERPYSFTHEELLFAVHVERQGFTKTELKSRRADLWKEFFAKPRACMRASMLPKKFGWGLHFDAQGRVALVAVESEEYRRFVSGDKGTAVVTAMRNKRPER